MSKKTINPEIISYGNISLAINTIAGFYPIHESRNMNGDMYGIHFLLRSGSNISAEGNSIILRDRVIKYLQTRLTTIVFKNKRCDSCVNFSGDNPDRCDLSQYFKEANGRKPCRSIDGYPNFKAKPEEECITIMSTSRQEALATQ